MDTPKDSASKGKTYEELMASAKARAAEAKARMDGEVGNKATESKQLMLPFWPDVARGVPNAALRSALFGAIKKGARAYLERQEIHAQDGIRIVYTGARLDQGDLDVWETVLHIARAQALGDECRVTAYQLLKALGKTDTGINRDTLDRRLSRMKATGVDVKVGKFSYEGSLIDEVYRAEESREYVIRLNPKLSALFAADQFTQVDWVIRRELSGQPLAQWLHGFYSSHAKPYPMRIDTLLELSGSENTSHTSARQTFKKAMDAVTKACKVHEQDFSYEIIHSLVYVKKEASEAQKRHLAKRLNGPKKPGI